MDGTTRPGAAGPSDGGRSLRSLLAAGTAALAFGTGAASAVEPVGAPEFNPKTAFDLKALTTAHVHDVPTPAAKAEGATTFQDFGEPEKELFAEIIERFEAKTGVTVDDHQVDGEQAVQQLIAAKQAGQPSPVDVFRMPNGQARVADEAGVIANLSLAMMLPSAPDLEPSAAPVSRG